MFSTGDETSKRPLWRTLLQWGIVATIFYFIGASLADGAAELSSSNLRFDVLGLAISVVLLALYMVGRAVIWHHLTSLLGSRIPIGKAMVGWFYSQLGKYVPGKVFLYLGRLHYYRQEGADLGKVSLAFGLELVATFSSSILTVLVAALTLQSDEIARYRPAMVAALMLLLISLHPRVLNIVTKAAYRLLKREPFEVTVSYTSLLRFVALYVANWVVFGMALYAFINSFFPLPSSTILFLAGAFSFASMMGMIAVFVPSGLGVREGLLGVFLAQVMPVPVALLAAVAARVWFTVVELVAAGFAAMAARRFAVTGPPNAIEIGVDQ